MALKGIIFDLDGTLGDTMPVVIEALRETFRVYAGREYSEEEIMPMFGPSEEGVIRPRVAGADYDAALRLFLHRYTELHREALLFAGVLPLLGLLRARGIRRGVVTGKGRGTAEISMRMLKLEPYIETLVTGSEEGAEKPDGIRRVLAEWGIEPGEAAYVGDMPYDMRAAREVGVLPLGAAWASSATVVEEEGLQVFRTVAALEQWFRAV